MTASSIAPTNTAPVPSVKPEVKRYTIQQKSLNRWETVASRDTEQLIKMALGALTKKHPTAEFRVKDGTKVIELSKPEPKGKALAPIKPELALPTYGKVDAKKSAFEMTERGIVWNGKPSIETVKSAKDALNTTQIGLGFAQADTLRELVDVYKVDVNTAANMFVTGTGGKMAVAYAKSLLQMARNVPIGNRNPAISVTHHVAVKNSPQDQQARLLAIAVKDSLSVVGLQNVIRGEQPRKTTGQGSGGGRAARTPSAPAEKVTPGVQTDTRGNVTAQPINTTGTGSNADKALIVTEEHEKQLRTLAAHLNVTPQQLLNKMLADTIAVAERKIADGTLKPVPATNNAEKPAQKQETTVKPPVAPTLPIDDYDNPGEFPELPVNAETVNEAMSLDVNATPETVAFRLNTTVDAVLPYMTPIAPPPAVQKVGGKRK